MSKRKDSDDNDGSCHNESYGIIQTPAKKRRQLAGSPGFPAIQSPSRKTMGPRPTNGSASRSLFRSRFTNSPRIASPLAVNMNSSTSTSALSSAGFTASNFSFSISNGSNITSSFPGLIQQTGHSINNPNPQLSTQLQFLPPQQQPLAPVQPFDSAQNISNNNPDSPDAASMGSVSMNTGSNNSTPRSLSTGIHTPQPTEEEPAQPTVDQWRQVSQLVQCVGLGKEAEEHVVKFLNIAMKQGHSVGGLETDDIVLLGACIIWTCGQTMRENPLWKGRNGEPIPWRRLFKGLPLFDNGLQNFVTVTVHRIFHLLADLPTLMEESDPNITSLLRTRAGEYNREYTQMLDLYRSSLELFNGLTTFNIGHLGAETLPGEVEGTSSPARRKVSSDLLRYCWLLYLIMKSRLNVTAVSENQTLCIVAVLFVIAQLPSACLRPIPEICAQLLPGRPVPDNLEWLDAVRYVVCARYNLDSGNYMEAEKLIVSKIFTELFQIPVKDDPFFVATEPIDQQESNNWNLRLHQFTSAFEMSGSFGHFYRNIRAIETYYLDTFLPLNGSGVEIDYTMFLPLPQWLSMAPERRGKFMSDSAAKTPNTSTSTSSSTTKTGRSLRSSFEKASSLSYLMPFTPLSARQVGCVNPQDAGKDKQNLLAFLQPKTNDPEHYFQKFLKPETRDDILHLTRERMRNVYNVVCIRDPTRQQLWDLSLKLYLNFAYSILDEFVCKVPHFDVTKVLKDGQFHRAIMLCAFESINYLWFHNGAGSQMQFFQMLNRSIGADRLVLSMVIEMITASCRGLPRTIEKRLKMLEERVLEKDLWTEETVYDFILVAKKHPTDNEPKLYPTILFHHALERPKETCELSPDVICANVVKSLMGKMSRMVRLRITEIFQVLVGKSSLATEDPTRVQEISQTALWLVGYVLTYELDTTDVTKIQKTRFLQNRHADAILLSCIYTAACYHNSKVTMRLLIQCYGLQPQYMAENIQNIPLQPDTTGTLIQFHNQIMMPIVRKFLKFKEANKGKTDVSADPFFVTPLHMTPAVHRRLAELKGGPQIMTPLSKKLTNTEEDPQQPGNSPAGRNLFKAPSPMTHAGGPSNVHVRRGLRENRF